MPWGTDRKFTIDGKEYTIRSKSNLAKLIQIFSVANGKSVEHKNKSNLESEIDGNLGRFSAQGILDLKQMIQKEETRGSLTELQRFLASQWVDALKNIEQEFNWGRSSQDVRDQSFEYDKYRQVFTIGSFGKKSELNTATGKISVSIGGKSFEYPYSVQPQ